MNASLSRGFIMSKISKENLKRLQAIRDTIRDDNAMARIQYKPELRKGPAVKKSWIRCVYEHKYTDHAIKVLIGVIIGIVLTRCIPQ
jgi:hypothetical protein